MKAFMGHIYLQMQKRWDNWSFKRSYFIFLDLYMSIIVDDMDQNTIIIPKMRQVVQKIRH